MPADDKQLALALLDGMSNDDEAALASVLADDVKWWGPPSALAQGMPAPVRGRAAVAALLARPDQFFHPGTRRWTAHHVLSEDGVVAVHANLKGSTQAGGAYTNEYVFIVKVDAGLVAEVWEHVDTAQFAALMFPG